MTTELQVLQDYIKNDIGYDGDISPETDLLKSQVMDSFSIVQMAIFVQDHFGIEFDAEDLVRENLSTLARVVELIQRKKSGLAAGQTGQI